MITFHHHTAGAGEQNGSCEAKKQSSSSQAESNLAEEQQRLLARNSSSDQLGMPSSGPSGGLKKSSSSGSIPSNKSLRQQSRSVRKSHDHFDEVQERRRLIEEKRQEALKKQINEKEKRRQKALEVRRPMSKQLSPRATNKKTLETPSIVVKPASPEPSNGKVKSPKPATLPIRPSEKASSTKSAVSPTSPRSPKSPPSHKGEVKVPTKVNSPRRASPTYKVSPPSSKPPQVKKTTPSPKQTPIKKFPRRKVKKQQEVPPILEDVEPTGSDEGSTTDEAVKVEPYSSVTICYSTSTETKSDKQFPVEAEHPVKETHHRRLTLQEGHCDYSDKRKASHPAMKFPEKVEYTPKPSNPYKDLTSDELERRKREYKPRPSATAYCASMRPDGGSSLLGSLISPYKPTSAPVSRVTTPSSSRSNSPKRHVSWPIVCLCATNQSFYFLVNFLC